MTLQLLICLALVAAAALWLGKSLFRQTRNKAHCGGNCPKCEATGKIQ